MGKHHRRSNFTRNAAAFGATVAGVTALAVPTASAQPISIPDFGSFAEVPGVDNIIGQIPGADAIQSAAPAAAPAISTGQKIVDAARSQIGTPYVWGGAQPGGFDCSGLTSWSYSQVGKSIPRTSQDQYAQGTKVADRQPGDIIVFYSGASHVGIYSGGNNVIHAPQTGDVVKEVPVDYMPVTAYVRF